MPARERGERTVLPRPAGLPCPASPRRRPRHRLRARRSAARSGRDPPARELLRVGTRRRRSGPVMDVVTADVRLDGLPALTCWPEDGGPFITLALVYTEHPEGKGSNLGLYRLQVYDARRTGMHWQIGKGGGFHYAVAEARRESLPVTALLGGPPALTLAAVAP